MAGMSQDSLDLTRRRLEDSLAIKRDMLESECVSQATAVAAAMIGALRAGGKVLFFGNGGSSMDAGHLAAELAGRFYRDRPGRAPPAGPGPRPLRRGSRNTQQPLSAEEEARIAALTNDEIL